MSNAPAPSPAELVETVARALWTEAQATAFMTVDPTEHSREERYRRLAAAAIAALPPSPAEEAIKRVEALAESWRYKGEFGWGAWQEGQGPDLEGSVLDQASADLRAALDPAGADSGEGR